MEFIQKVFVQEAKEKNKEREGKTQIKQQASTCNQTSKVHEGNTKPFTPSEPEHLQNLAG
jgi:hypothetical protein